MILAGEGKKDCGRAPFEISVPRFLSPCFRGSEVHSRDMLSLTCERMGDVDASIASHVRHSVFPSASAYSLMRSINGIVDGHVTWRFQFGMSCRSSRRSRPSSAAEQLAHIATFSELCYCDSLDCCSNEKPRTKKRRCKQNGTHERESGLCMRPGTRGSLRAWTVH